MLTLIGDVHGRISDYLYICQNKPYTIALGDVSFRYDEIESKLDPTRHKILGGNHDNLPDLKQLPHNLGDYGPYSHGGHDFFFVRGAFSIDMIWRQVDFLNSGNKTWWYEEELSLREMMDCLKQYKKVKPDKVFTHAAPEMLLDIIGKPGILKSFGWENYVSRTAELLQMMWDIHQPSLWVFGHFHQRWEKQIEKTRFVCLPELGRLEL